MHWQPDSQTVYMYFELSLICCVFQVVSSSESKILIFSESRVLENGAACSKGSSVISKTVAFMDSGRRCENKQGFVFISENISALPGFTSAGLEALQAPHLNRNRTMWKALLYSNMISKEEEAARTTTANCCDTALCCTVSLHPAVWSMTQCFTFMPICIELKHKAPTFYCVFSNSVSHPYEEVIVRITSFHWALCRPFAQGHGQCVHNVVICIVRKDKQPVLE